MATDQPVVAGVERNQLAHQLFHWSMFWLKVGVWICGLAGWLFHRWFPGVTTRAGYVVGVLTGLAMFYLMHYLVFTACGRTVRRICLPLVALMDILAIGGVIALFFKTSLE